MNKFSISVVMPSYNHGRYVRDALDRVIAQSRKPDEVLLINDGSTDETAKIMQEYADRFTFVNFVHYENNQGICKICKDAMNLANGDYYLGIGADDPVHQGFIEEAMSLLESHPEAGLCVAEYRFKAINGNQWDVTIPLGDKPVFLSPKAFASLLEGEQELSLPTCTMVWKKSALMELGGLIPSLRWHYDWFNALVIAFRYGICYIPKIYQTVNYDPDSYSIKGQSDWSQQIEVLRSIFASLDKPEFLDVRPFFKIPAAISKFGPLLIHVILENESRWEFLSWDLIRYALLQDELLKNYNFDILCNEDMLTKMPILMQVAEEILCGMRKQYDYLAENAIDTLDKYLYTQRAKILRDRFKPTIYDEAVKPSQFYNYWIGSKLLKVTRWIKLINELPNDISISIYGAGRFGQAIYNMLHKERKDVKVRCFIESKPRQTHELDVPVYSVIQAKELLNTTIDCILICSIYYDEIIQSLQQNGVHEYICVDAREALDYIESKNYLFEVTSVYG